VCVCQRWLGQRFSFFRCNNESDFGKVLCRTDRLTASATSTYPPPAGGTVVLDTTVMMTIGMLSGGLNNNSVDYAGPRIVIDIARGQATCFLFWHFLLSGIKTCDTQIFFFLAFDNMLLARCGKFSFHEDAVIDTLPLSAIGVRQ
jgi:hypothetical protein